MFKGIRNATYEMPKAVAINMVTALLKWNCTADEIHDDKVINDVLKSNQDNMKIAAVRA